MTLPFAIPTLTTARLTLRPPRESDLETLVAFGQSERTVFVGGKRDRFEAWRGFLAVIGHWALRGYGYWSVDTRAGEFVGRVGISQHDGWPEPELGWHLFDGHEGQGYATEAALAARDHAYTVWGMGPVVSYIAHENHRSRGVAERLGARFEREGPEGEPHPYGIWRHPGADGHPLTRRTA